MIFCEKSGGNYEAHAIKFRELCETVLSIGQTVVKTAGVTVLVLVLRLAETTSASLMKCGIVNLKVIFLKKHDQYVVQIWPTSNRIGNYLSFW
jgi:hypothetical protein